MHANTCLMEPNACQCMSDGAQCTLDHAALTAQLPMHVAARCVMPMREKCTADAMNATNRQQQQPQVSKYLSLPVEQSPYDLPHRQTVHAKICKTQNTGVTAEQTAWQPGKGNSRKHPCRQYSTDHRTA